MTATRAHAAPPARELATALRAEVFAADRFHRLDEAAIARCDAVWFGVGLCGRTPSVALPIDVLVLVVGQELLRRALGARRSLVLVADTNARAVGHAAADIERGARRVESTLASVARTLQLPLECVRASAIAPWSEHARQRPRVADLPPYEAHQLVQMEVMRRAGATVKLGWVMPGGARDERAFDRLHVSRGGGPLAFAYTVSGRTLDPSRPRACPYVAERIEPRIVMSPDECIVDKLAAARDTAPREVAGYERLLRRITRGLARLRGAPGRDAAALQLQAWLACAEP